MFEYDLSPYRGDVSKPVVITGYHQNGNVNSAGGVIVGIGAYNNVQKDVKYFDFLVSYKDRVNEPVYGKISKGKSTVYRATGPFKYEAFMGGRWGPSFYNHASYCVELENVKIEYMDGTTLELSDELLEDTFVFNDGNKCRKYPSK